MELGRQQTLRAQRCGKLEFNTPTSRRSRQRKVEIAAWQFMRQANYAQRRRAIQFHSFDAHASCGSLLTEPADRGCTSEMAPRPDELGIAKDGKFVQF